MIKDTQTLFFPGKFIGVSSSAPKCDYDCVYPAARALTLELSGTRVLPRGCVPIVHISACHPKILTSSQKVNKTCDDLTSCQMTSTCLLSYTVLHVHSITFKPTVTIFQSSRHQSSTTKTFTQTGYDILIRLFMVSVEVEG